MRTILDGELRRWEVFASTGEFGGPNPAKLVFRCTSDPGLRPKVFVYGGDKSDAEKAVAEAHDRELLKMLEAARKVG